MGLLSDSPEFLYVVGLRSKNRFRSAFICKIIRNDRHNFPVTYISLQPIYGC